MINLMICPQCGTDTLDSDQLCPKCGRELQIPTQQTSDTQYTQYIQSQQGSAAQYAHAHSQAGVSAKGATASFVCGIIGLVSPLLCCCFPASITLGIIAVVMGNKAKKLGDISIKPIDGTVMGIISIVIGILLLILIAVDIAVVGTFTKSFMEGLNTSQQSR
jgi:rRNA maturation protein Nop10